MFHAFGAKLQMIFDQLRTSLWFVPSLLVLLAISAAIILPEMERRWDIDGSAWSRLINSGTPEAARALLTTVAGSMITVAGVVFSITVVALTLASTQFGPRLLRNFMRDTGNQMVLATFIATFVYSLTLLKTIRSESYGLFVPHLSVTFALVLAILSIGALIYFIHHIATEIQAECVIFRVKQELDQNMDRLYPEVFDGDGVGEEGDGGVEKIGPFPCNTPVHFSLAGYIQAIDADAIFDVAQREEGVIEMEVKPGDYLVKGSRIACIHGNREPDESVVEEIQSCLVAGRRRTPVQDIRFSIDQLVEIGVRALSPGINDPFTAEICIDQLSDVFCQLARRKFPSQYRVDEKGELRAVFPGYSFAALMDSGFDQIRQSCGHHTSVIRKLLNSLQRIGSYATSEEQIQSVMDHALKLQHHIDGAGLLDGEMSELSRLVEQIQTVCEECTVSN